MRLDSDPDSGGFVAPFMLNSGQNRTNIDAGLSLEASLGDWVWHDLDANGVQNSGEPGLAGVSVRLYSSTDGYLRTATTDGSGAYRFDGLRPGSYYVQVVAPGAYLYSPDNAGSDDTLDSDGAGGFSPTYTLAPGENNLTVDGGLYQNASISGQVWHDLNANGIQDAGEPFMDPGGGGTTTINLWREESGGSGAMSWARVEIIATTTVAANGSFSFTNLMPGGPNRSYMLEFDFMPFPEFGISPRDMGGDDTRDSDIDGGGSTVMIIPTSGQNLTSWDAGFFNFGWIEVTDPWNDQNANGVRDGSDSSLPGFSTITLHRSDGSVVWSGTSGTGGMPSMPGTYYVTYTLPPGWEWTIPGADSHVDGTGTTPLFTLPSGGFVTRSAGMYQNFASLNGQMWHDLNGNGIQDAGEPFRETFGGTTTVELLSGGSPIAATTAAADGSFSFANLAPGPYSLHFVFPMELEFMISPQGQGGDGTLDSDIDSSGYTADFTLMPGQNETSIDAGFMYSGGSDADRSVGRYERGWRELRRTLPARRDPPDDPALPQ